jgi:phosphinothricin acetyltransferase
VNTGAKPVSVRPALASDLPALRDLRNHYVAHSNATFDEQPLSDEALRQWMQAFAPQGPHRLLVAEDADGLLGFASSQPYRAHPAFRHTVETSIYCMPQVTGRGVGSALYGALFADLRGQRLHRAVVGIALPNEASIGLHEKFGFKAVGVFDQYATKRGVHVSSLWMQRAMEQA